MQTQTPTQPETQPGTMYLRWVDLVRVLGSFFVVMAHLNYTQVKARIRLISIMRSRALRSRFSFY